MTELCSEERWGEKNPLINQRKANLVPFLKKTILYLYFNVIVGQAAPSPQASSLQALRLQQCGTFLSPNELLICSLHLLIICHTHFNTQWKTLPPPSVHFSQ